MADTIKTSAELKFDLTFNDGDTRVVTLKNPRVATDLAALTTAMTAHGSIFAGDKAGGTYTGFTNARKVATTTRHYDLNE